MESVIASRREREKPQQAQDILCLLCFLWFLPIFLSDLNFQAAASGLIFFRVSSAIGAVPLKDLVCSPHDAVLHFPHFVKNRRGSANRNCVCHFGFTPFGEWLME